MSRLQRDELAREELERLVVERLAHVLALDPRRIRLSARFEEDLRADSLDLVEMIEATERALRARGFTVSLGDDDLRGLRTVGQAVERLHAHVTRTRAGG